MKRLLIFFKYCFLYFSLLGLESCSFIDIDPPTDRITTGILFKDEATAKAAVLGLYGVLTSTIPPFSNGATTIYTGLASDELVYNGPATEQLDFFMNSLSSRNSIVSNGLWRQSYQVIYQATACIENLEKSQLSESVKTRLLGESYFIRAFCYWYLTNLFGEVPLAKTTDYTVNAALRRSPINEVNDYILADLLHARDLLLPGDQSEGKVRVNYYTVLALLSRYYLYHGQNDEAEKLCTEIIDSKRFNLEPLNQVFLAISKEAIWQLSMDMETFNTLEGNRFIPAPSATAKPNYSLSHSLFLAFEPGDLRFASWVGTKNVANIQYLFPYKYKVRSNLTKTEYNVVFRLAETYLIRSESRIKQGKYEQALEDLNIIRKRANLAETTINDPLKMEDAIFQESRIEFFAEWGHRWFDLKRTGRMDSILGKEKLNWKSTSALFPIPADEIIKNSNLQQNDGYSIN